MLENYCKKKIEIKLDNISVSVYNTDSWLDIELDDFIVTSGEDDEAVTDKARGWFLLHGGIKLAQESGLGIMVFRESLSGPDYAYRTFFKGSPF